MNLCLAVRNFPHFTSQQHPFSWNATIVLHLQTASVCIPHSPTKSTYYLHVSRASSSYFICGGLNAKTQNHLSPRRLAGPCASVLHFDISNINLSSNSKCFLPLQTHKTTGEGNGRGRQANQETYSRLKLWEKIYERREGQTGWRAICFRLLIYNLWHVEC